MREVESAIGEDGKEYLMEGLYWNGNEEVLAEVKSKILEATRMGKGKGKEVEVEGDWKENTDPWLLPLPRYYGMNLLEKDKPFR